MDSDECSVEAHNEFLKTEPIDEMQVERLDPYDKFKEQL